MTRDVTVVPDQLTDPVDWAAHYWEQHQLSGDEQRFLTVTSLLRFERIVASAVERELRKHSLHTTDYLLLMALQLSETGTRLVSSLARNLMVHATTATLAADRLEARQLLTRAPHPSDRRATCVTITDSGRRFVAAVTRELSDIRFGLPESDPGAVDALTAALTTMRGVAGDTG